MPIADGTIPKFVIHDGMALDASVWRITGGGLSVDEFMSYIALGRDIMVYQFFRATGVSMYFTRQGAVDRRYYAANREKKLAYMRQRADSRRNGEA